MILRLTTHMGGLTYQGFSPDALLARGVPQTVIDDALLAQHAEVVNSEATRRILAVASIAAQSNMSLAVGVIGAKAEAQRTTEETDVLLGAQAVLDWVQQMRAQAGQHALDVASAFNDDATWPAVPPEATAAAAQF